MKRIRYSTVLCVASLVIALAGTAFATPAPNSAKLDLRIFNDCPISVLTPINAYPGMIQITDAMAPACVGFANLHSWSFSEDGGVTQSLFKNSSNFKFGAFFNMTGPGNGEGGLRISPWWSQLVDGRFMVKSIPGDFIPFEVSVWGGRLPFYSFTANHGVTYVKGTTVYMEATYLANGLSSASPATIQYRYIDGTGVYSSPALPFDMANPAEDPPHGLWGMLHDGMVGGYFQPRANTGAPLTATWTEITFTVLDVVPTLQSTWGRIKTLYR